MAQETAGTIGIPVYKNEVLPALEAFARRRERADIYKARQAQRAAELEAKKAEELNKYIPPAFETAKGGYWQPYIKQRTESEKSIALQRIKDAKTTAEKAKAAQDFNAITQELNYAGELETQKQKENLKALQETGYVADENALSQYYREQAATNPKFGETNHIVGFQEWLKKNPEQYVSPAVIGSRLLKQYQPREIEIQGKSQKEKFVFNPLFEPEKMKDELTGANIYRAEKVNPATAYEALQSNPALLKAAEAYIEPIAARVQRDNPGMSNTEAYTMASGEFFTKALREGRAKEAYDYSDIVRGRKSGAGGGASDQYTMSIATKAGAGKHRFNVQALSYGKDKSGAMVVKAKPQPQYSTVGSKDDVKYPYSTEYSHPGNREVRVLQSDEDAEGYAERLPDGGYLLKSGFKYSSPTKRTLYFADEDLYFGGTEKAGVPGKNWTLIKKGDEVPPQTALGRINSAKKQGKPSGIVQQTGYEVTANFGGGTSLNIFVPQESAGEIDKHIQMEQQKKRRKSGPETQVNEPFSGEVELIR